MLAVWVFAAAVSFSFVPVRTRLASSAEPIAGAVVVPLPASSLPQGLTVGSYRLHNRGPDPVVIEARLDERLVERAEIPAGASPLVRSVWPPAGAAPVTFRLSGPPDGWVVDSFEVSNRTGFARGLLNLDVVPRGQRVDHPSWLAVALLIACAAAAGRLVPARLAPRLRLAWSAVAVVSLVILAAVAAAPVLSPYEIVLSPRTFALLALVLSLRRLTTIAAFVRDRVFTPHARPAARFLAVAGCGLIAASVFTSAAVQEASRYGGNYSGFLHLSKAWAVKAPFLRERSDLAARLVQFDDGYDGQFMYLMAFDPWLQRFADSPERYGEVVDAPPYRYGRIGFSALTRVAARQEPDRFPLTMLLLILGSHLVLGAALAALARRHGCSPLAGLIYLAVPGFLASLVFALPESLAAAAVVCGLLALDSRRRFLAAGCFACALLVRETAIVLIAALILGAMPRGDWRPRLLLVGTACVPVAAWRTYVGWRLVAAHGLGAFLPNPGDLTVPFAGLDRLMRAGLSGTQPAPEVLAAVAYPLLLAAGLGLAVWALIARLTPLAIAAVVYGAIAVSLNYEQIWSHVPSGERGTTELYLALLLWWLCGDISQRSLRRAVPWFFGAAAVYTLALSPEAGVARAALLLIR